LVQVSITFNLDHRSNPATFRLGAIVGMGLLPLVTVLFSAYYLGWKVHDLTPDFGAVVLWLAVLVAMLQFVGSVTRVGRSRAAG
jgi:hypothetical protein